VPAPPDLDEETRHEREQLLREIASKERRRRRRQRHPPTVWSGLGVFGMVGWLITVPTLIGIAVALWVNSIYPGTWTLGFFFLGLAIGCINAWLWVERERRKVYEDDDEDDDME